MIQCNEITQNINYLLAQFQDCTVLQASDMQLLVELIAAVNTCANGGPDYNTLITDLYEPIIDTLVVYPANLYHSISIMILEGTITREINGEQVTFPTGTVLKHHLTNLNQLEYRFIANAGSKVVVEYLIETIEIS